MLGGELGEVCAAFHLLLEVVAEVEVRHQNVAHPRQNLISRGEPSARGQREYTTGSSQPHEVRRNTRTATARLLSGNPKTLKSMLRTTFAS